MTIKSSINPKLIGRAILKSPVELALQILGDRCTLLILKEIWLGKRRFEHFRASSGVSRGTLSSRLKFLVDHGVIYKDLYNTSPKRYEYKLTDKGIATYPIAIYFWQWEMEYAEDFKVPELFHLDCGNYLDISTNCSHCNEEISLNNVRYEIVSKNDPIKYPIFKPRRSEANNDLKNTNSYMLIELVGNRWTGLVYAGLLYGLKRFDEFHNALGIATNILSDRLKKLLDAGIIRKKVYQRKPSRYEYLLTEKGRIGYLMTIHLFFWANKWMLFGSENPVHLFHENCGNAIKSVHINCKDCNKVINPSKVSYNDLRKAIIS